MAGRRRVCNRLARGQLLWPKGNARRGGKGIGTHRKGNAADRVFVPPAAFAGRASARP